MNYDVFVVVVETATAVGLIVRVGVAQLPVRNPVSFAVTESLQCTGAMVVRYVPVVGTVVPNTDELMLRKNWL